MSVKPIPVSLLSDSFLLFTPSESGYRNELVRNVRVVRKSEITDRSAVNVRDVSELTVYYDCVSSYPRYMEFAAGMLIQYEDISYEVIRVEEFSAEKLHHIRITARKV